MKTLRLLVLALVAVLTQFPAANAQLALTWEPVSGLNLPSSIEVFRANEPSPTFFLGYMVRADTLNPEPLARSPQWRFDVTYVTAGQTVATHAANVPGALVAINGGYFGGGQSYSLAVSDGVTFASNIAQITRDGLAFYPTRAALGQTAGGFFETAWTYNVGGTQYAYPTPNANAPLAPQPRPTATFPAGGSPWGLAEGIGGGPMLVRDGVIDISWTEEVFFGGSGVDTTSVRARSAIGIDDQGRLLLFSTRENRGATLREVAQIMRSFNAIDAINLDGGGSSALWADGSYLIPSARPVVTAVVLRAPSAFEPIVVDNGSASAYSETSGWFESSNAPFYGVSPSRLNEVGTGDEYATFRFPETATYSCATLEAWWTSGSNRASNTPFTIYQSGEGQTFRLDQSGSNTSNKWNQIGFVFGRVDSVRVSDDAVGTFAPSFVSVDAVRLIGAVCPAIEDGLDASIPLTVAPNPASDTPYAAFEVRTPGAVEIQVVDMLGRTVQSWAQDLGAGPHRVSVPVAGLSGGVYFLHLRTADGRASQAFTLLR